MGPMMQFAVLQKEPTPPAAERLKRAFRAFSNLTDADAVRVATATRGILMRYLDVDLARAFQRALQAEGVGAVMVAENELPVLPEALSLTRAELWPQALTIYDPVGQARSVPWNTIRLLAAGAAQAVEGSRTHTEFLRLLLQAPAGTPPKRADDAGRRLETGAQLLLEILPATGSVRYQVDAAQFAFKHVIDRPGLATEEKFIWLVREMARHAEGALLNHGARRLCAGETLVPEYRSRRMLTDEIVWLLWHSGHKPGLPNT
jgi:hypothetical protein